MKQPQPIPRQGKHPKRGFAFIDTAKEINVWLYRVKDDSTYVVCDSPNFEPSATYYDAKRSDLKDLYQKRQSSISSKPKALTVEEKAHKASLNVFFASQMVGMPFLCSECEQPLKAFTNFEKRCTIAHILSKSKFTSVACNPQNIIYLCAKGGCHHKFDNCTSKERSLMNCYPLVLERFNNIKHNLSQSELVSAYTFLNIKWQ